MADRWERPVWNAHTLNVFPTPSVTGGPWAGVFTRAMDEVNRLSGKHGLGVTLKRSGEAPDPSGHGGAEVQFDTLDGTTNFIASGRAATETLSGIALEGVSKFFLRSGRGGEVRIAKVYIFVPATPKVGGRSSREVGDEVKLVIAAHELIHACGMGNEDHSPLADPDFFFGNPSLRSGADPADDRIVAGNPARELTPLTLSTSTAGRLAILWRVPFFPMHFPVPHFP